MESPEKLRIVYGCLDSSASWPEFLEVSQEAKVLDDLACEPGGLVESMSLGSLWMECDVPGIRNELPHGFVFMVAKLEVGTGPYGTGCTLTVFWPEGRFHAFRLNYSNLFEKRWASWFRRVR